MRLTKLVQYISPFIDKTVAKAGFDIVLYHDTFEIRLLMYDSTAEMWYINGFYSLEEAAAQIIPEADFYYHSKAYIDDPSYGYAVLTQESNHETWNNIYDDITEEQTKVDHPLLAEEQLLRILTTNAQIGLFACNENGHVTYVNDEWFDVTDIPSDEMMDLGWVKYFGEHINSKLVEEASKSIEAHRAFGEKIQLNNKWIHIQIRLASRNDLAAGYVGTAIDITQQKIQELQLEKTVQEKTSALEVADHRFHSLLESMPLGMILIDTEGKIIIINSMAQQLLDYSQLEIFGQDVEILIPERFRNKHAEHRKEYITSPVAINLRQLMVLSKNGTEIAVDVWLGPIQDDGQTLVSCAICEANKIH